MNYRFFLAAARATVALSLTLGAQSAWAQYTSSVVRDSATTVFDDARINTSGQIAYRASTGAATTTNAFYIDGVRIAGRTDPTPYGSTFGALDSTYVFNDMGDILFRNNVNTGGGVTDADNQGMFRYSAATGTVSTVFREGNTVFPGNGTSTGFGSYDMNNNGDIAVAVATPFRALFRQVGGTLSRVANSGDTIAGLDGNVDNFSFGSLDDNGNLSFRSAVTGSSNPNTDDGIFNFEAATGNITPILLGGDVAPNIMGATNGRFDIFDRIVRSGNSTIAFEAFATPDGTSTALTSLWTITPGGSLSALAVRNGAAPTGGRFGTGFDLGNINDSGTGVFRSSVMTGGPTSVVWAFTGATLTPIAAIGDTIGGNAITALGIPSINNAGQVVYSYTAGGRRGIALAALAPAVVPESGTVSLLVTGFAALGAIIVRRRRNA